MNQTQGSVDDPDKQRTLEFEPTKTIRFVSGLYMLDHSRVTFPNNLLCHAMRRRPSQMRMGSTTCVDVDSMECAENTDPTDGRWVTGEPAQKWWEITTGSRRYKSQSTRTFSMARPTKKRREMKMAFGRELDENDPFREWFMCSTTLRYFR